MISQFLLLAFRIVCFCFLSCGTTTSTSSQRGVQFMRSKFEDCLLILLEILAGSEMVTLLWEQEINYLSMTKKLRSLIRRFLNSDYLRSAHAPWIFSKLFVNSMVRCPFSTLNSSDSAYLAAKWISCTRSYLLYSRSSNSGLKEMIFQASWICRWICSLRKLNLRRRLLRRRCDHRMQNSPSKKRNSPSRKPSLVS